MTTTEFIKLIKDCQPDRKKLFRIGYHTAGKAPENLCVITENELEKIEKVNVELLEACKYAYDLLLQQAAVGRYPDSALLKNKGKGFAPIINGINNASNIKQI